MFLEKLFKRKTSYNPLSADLLQEYNKQRPLGPQKLACYAPVKSMYFGHHGKALACCYNRTHVLGEYPQKSIKEIWFSAEADKLRDYIKNNDFSSGCLGCKEQLVAGNFDGVKAKQYDERTLNANRYPSVLEFELSNVCNLECEMCNGNFSSLIRTKREKLPALENPYDSEFVKQLEEFIPYLDEVKFYGGEPFLIEIYYEIWEKIIELNPNVRISVQTNATVLNNRVKRILEQTNFHVNVSFDSLQKETYEKIRINAEFERTFENLKWFREYTRQRNTYFGVSVCVMRQNWKELPDFVKFCNEIDAPVYFHTVVVPSHCSIREMSMQEIKDIYEYLKAFTPPADTSIEKKNKAHYEGIRNQVKAWDSTSVVREQLRIEKINSFTDLGILLEQHIQNDIFQQQSGKQERIAKIKEKIKGLEELVGPAGFKKIVGGISITDPYLFDSLVFHLETLPLATLVQMAKNRTEPTSK